jgi:hypothetical protein
MAASAFGMNGSIAIAVELHLRAIYDHSPNAGSCFASGKG